MPGLVTASTTNVIEKTCALISPSSFLHLRTVADYDALPISAACSIGKHFRYTADLVGVQRRINLGEAATRCQGWFSCSS